MIEVLKRGSLPGDKYHFATCVRCSSELRFQTSDTVEVPMLNKGYRRLALVCPVCTYAIFVEAAV